MQTVTWTLLGGAKFTIDYTGTTLPTWQLWLTIARLYILSCYAWLLCGCALLKTGRLPSLTEVSAKLMNKMKDVIDSEA